jgi:Tfp pilus assembly protein PilF
VYVNGTRDPVAQVRALEATERAIALDPNSAAGYGAAASYYTTAAPDANKASAAMDRALQLAPNDANVLVRAASLDRASGKPDAAATNLERARELDPRSVSSHCASGVVYQ